MSDQLVTETATYTTHNKHKKRIFMPLARSEPAIPAMKQLQTYDLDRTATGIGPNVIYNSETDKKTTLKSSMFCAVRPVNVYTPVTAHSSTVI
jgi:hypothetical protein